MKAIKGLEDRLYALDQMIASCKKLVNEQKELAQVKVFIKFGRLCGVVVSALALSWLGTFLCGLGFLLGWY